MKTQSTFLVYFKLILLFSFSLFACSQEGNKGKLQNEKESDVSLGKEQVLFIGNSHTYYNQGISTHLSRFRANDSLQFEPLIQEVTVGGFSLQDHLSNQSTLDKINERSWYAIVLQENTSVASESLASSIDAMKSFSEMVKSKGSKVFLFMTWPYKDTDMLTGIRETYQNGVMETGAVLVPVGTQWQTIDENQEVDIDLYDPDGIHPTLEGSFYATAMFYSAIYDKVPAKNAYHAGLSIEVANYLKSKVD